ncbi:hypothetical protein PCO86_08010 [Pectobacteriaceae bacterium CE70]|nr:hypothetical protein PCO86_08010 [Pectobacteriaceae bacterium CE70]WJY12260.1 hypothetical protein PCO80_07855 [Pectobacteriaceae bacterium C80]
MTSNLSTNLRPHQPTAPVELVLFDLLTALLDSWTLWSSVAGSDHMAHGVSESYLWLRQLSAL